MYDVAVIGCGIVGAAAAYELSRYNCRVLVLEAKNDVANVTTKANSAILHAGYDPTPGTLMAETNVRGVALAKELCEKLDVEREEIGSLVLAFGEEDERHLEKLYQQGLANGVPGIELLTADEVHALEPNVSDKVTAALALICLAALASGMIRDGIQTWTPTYLHDIYGLDNTFAIVLTFTLPLVNLCGVYMGKWANDHIFHSEAVTAAAAFLAACALLAAPAVGVRLPLWACLALLGLCAALMLAANTMLVTLVPLRLQSTGRISALSGLLNSATYAGSTLSGYGMGLLLERSGWPAALLGLCAGALAASLLCAAAARGWKRLRG